ncbi:uncharacterized protein BKA78DRAFT_160944 [Phyllosticta capitalensis]|uniref:uncharacterized protein n=1 Tax=Phyllosticta capitalensis TaxID=121624 RepID=UPI00312DD4F6
MCESSVQQGRLVRRFGSIHSHHTPARLAPPPPPLAVRVCHSVKEYECVHPTQDGPTNQPGQPRHTHPLGLPVRPHISWQLAAGWPGWAGLGWLGLDLGGRARGGRAGWLRARGMDGWMDICGSWMTLRGREGGGRGLFCQMFPQAKRAAVCWCLRMGRKDMDARARLSAGEQTAYLHIRDRGMIHERNRRGAGAGPPAYRQRGSFVLVVGCFSTEQGRQGSSR